MTGGAAALGVARTEGPGGCGWRGRAGSAVSLTARVSSSRACSGQQGQGRAGSPGVTRINWGAPHGQSVDGEINNVGRRRACQGGVVLSGLVACCHRFSLWAETQELCSVVQTINPAPLKMLWVSLCTLSSGSRRAQSSACLVSYLPASHGYL